MNAAPPGCSAVAVAGPWTAGSQTLFVRHYDYFPSFRRFSQLWRTYPAGGLPRLIIFVGHWDGVNAAGLVVAAASVAGRAASPGS